MAKKRYFVYNVFIGFYKILWKFTMRIKHEGKENIPKGGGYILASNHRTWYDPVMIAIPVKEQLFYMAKAELFENPRTRWFFNGIGAFPVDRGNKDGSALDRAYELLQQDRVLGIFPEGTRSYTQMPLAPKSGTALMVRTAKVDVLPVAVVFKGEGKPKMFSTITIKYGKLITYEDMFGTKEGEKQPSLKKVTHQLMDTITDMLELPPDMLELAKSHKPQKKLDTAKESE